MTKSLSQPQERESSGQGLNLPSSGHEATLADLLSGPAERSHLEPRWSPRAQGGGPPAPPPALRLALLRHQHGSRHPGVTSRPTSLQPPESLGRAGDATGSAVQTGTPEGAAYLARPQADPEAALGAPAPEPEEPQAKREQSQCKGRAPTLPLRSVLSRKVIGREHFLQHKP